MKKRYIYVFFASAIILIGLLVGYGIYVNTSSSAHVAKMAASQYVRVRSASVLFRDIAPVVYFPVVNIYSPNMLDVHFETDGTIVQVYVKPGDRVKAGQLLGEMANSGLAAEALQAEGKVRSVEANVVKWANTLRRYQMLAVQNAVSQQQLDEADTSLRAAEGELASAQAYHGEMVARLGRQHITAPCDGDILQVYHTQGTVVRSGDSLVMIGELNSLYLRNHVASDVLNQLQPFTGNFKMAIKRSDVVEKAYASPVKGGNPDGENSFELTIAQVSPPLDKPAQYRTVEYKIDNSTGLLEPGTYYQAKIYGTDKRRVLSVPKDSIMGDMEPCVFVVGPDSRLERRPVKTGIRDDDYVEIQSGLTENEIVVVAGNDTEYTPGMKVQVM